ncbi:MAG TPA: electron transfer flavoprotein subunit beta/FixA family protein [Candidatus Kapabacteria bacterium]|jgi:electron transfer flavoprotein beta subunit|nr:electron transfer flavoprotein subunit beta/FixA family protein [Candidatus Kapabacteria bacterium]
MNIVVCVSQVPDTTTKIVVGADGKSIDPKGVKNILNPYDELAVEEALRRKEGGTVTLVCVGGESAKEQLRLGLAMGADKAVLIKDEERVDSFSVAGQLAEAIRGLSPDLVLLGRQSIDYDSAQMGPTLAELLEMPCVSFVTSLEINGTAVRAERDIEGGKEVVETTLPCIITTQKGLNEPRYPKLPDIMKAKSKPVEELAGGMGDVRVSTLEMRPPEKKGAGKIFEASPENVKELVRLLHEEAKVI